jgi:hypothetical protein
MNLPQNAGLGAMMQTKGAGGAGITKQSMNEMMAKAQKLPDSELADVLAGRSMQVPQFAAMLAAMGRESLRTAVAGAQAGQAKEPSKKDQMLAKMSPQAQPEAPAGLETLPAPNMEQMGQGMADGGIIAFSAGDPEGVKDPDKQTPAEKAMAEYIRKIQKSSLFNRQVEPTPSAPSVYETDPQAKADREAISSFGRKAFDLTGSIAEAPFKGLGTVSDYLINRPLRAAGVPIPRVPSQFRYGAEEPKVSTAGDQEDPAGAVVPTAATTGTPPPPPPKTGADQTGGAPRGTAPGVAPTAVPAFESRRSAIDQLLAPTEDIAKQVASSKNQAQGEFLMQMGAALMSTPNVGVALSKGVAAGLPGLAANRKEINTIQKDQRDYRLNLSKAQEAAAQGKDDLAFKYADLAEKAKYHAGMIGAAMARSGAGDSRVATAAMNKAQDQLKLAMGDPRQRRNLGTVEAQQAFLNNAFQSNLSILSGQGPVTPSIPTYGAPPSGAVTRE